MTQFIIVETQGATGIITLNRPEKLNAWHAPMKLEIIEAFEKMDRSPEIRSIVLTGAGTKGFCAGQDLNEIKALDPKAVNDWRESFVRLYDVVRSATKPVVAALNGVAAGSGFQVALLADFRIGHPGVRMGQPEIHSGIVTTSGSALMMASIGFARTVDLTLTGRMMDADEAYRIGLINRIVPEADVLKESIALGEDLATRPATTMRLNKQRFKEMMDEIITDAREAGSRLQPASFAAGDAAKRIENFLGGHH